MCEVIVLYPGHSRSHVDGSSISNGTCTLVKCRHEYIVVDTMTPWDSAKLVAGLKANNVTCDAVSYVVCTHGHSDHTGNNNLFTNATKHIVGFDVSHGETYYANEFCQGRPYPLIDDCITVVPTPGHTAADVSVIVRTSNMGVVGITGDLFECEEDIENPDLWKDVGYAPLQDVQTFHRNIMIQRVDHIVPGHGPMFPVTLAMKETASAVLGELYASPEPQLLVNTLNQA